MSLIEGHEDEKEIIPGCVSGLGAFSAIFTAWPLVTEYSLGGFRKLEIQPSAADRTKTMPMTNPNHFTIAEKYFMVFYRCLETDAFPMLFTIFLPTRSVMSAEGTNMLRKVEVSSPNLDARYIDRVSSNKMMISITMTAIH